MMYSILPKQVISGEKTVLNSSHPLLLVIVIKSTIKPAGMMDVSISGLYNGEWGNFGCGASGSNIPGIVNKIVLNNKF